MSIQGTNHLIYPALLAVCTLASCGGKARDRGDTDAGPSATPAPTIACYPSSPSFSSVDAISAAPCVKGLPGGAVLDGVANEFPLSSDGTSTKWHLSFVGGDSGAIYVAEVTMAGSLVLATYGDGLICTKSVLGAVSSTTLVPDALARFSTLGLDTSGEAELRYAEYGDCTAQSTPQSIVVSVRPDPAGHGVGTQWWTAYYDSTGHFKRMCGPCKQAADSDCTACPP